jgi:hypothetical protein
LDKAEIVRLQDKDFHLTEEDIKSREENTQLFVWIEKILFGNRGLVIYGDSLGKAFGKFGVNSNISITVGSQLRYFRALG